MPQAQAVPKPGAAIKRAADQKLAKLRIPTGFRGTFQVPLIGAFQGVVVTIDCPEEGAIRLHFHASDMEMVKPFEGHPVRLFDITYGLSGGYIMTRKVKPITDPEDDRVGFEVIFKGLARGYYKVRIAK